MKSDSILEGEAFLRISKGGDVSSKESLGFHRWALVSFSRINTHGQRPLGVCSTWCWKLFLIPGTSLCQSKVRRIQSLLGVKLNSNISPKAPPKTRYRIMQVKTSQVLFYELVIQKGFRLGWGRLIYCKVTLTQKQVTYK